MLTLYYVHINDILRLYKELVLEVVCPGCRYHGARAAQLLELQTKVREVSQSQRRIQWAVCLNSVLFLGLRVLVRL